MISFNILVIFGFKSLKFISFIRGPPHLFKGFFHNYPKIEAKQQIYPKFSKFTRLPLCPILFTRLPHSWQNAKTCFRLIHQLQFQRHFIYSLSSLTFNHSTRNQNWFLSPKIYKTNSTLPPLTFNHHYQSLVQTQQT